MSADIAARNFHHARQLLALLLAHGIRELALAPGSRCAPLTLAAASDPRWRLHSHVDERGLAFFALGLARRLEQPVAVLVTSGTAVANLLPATIEADLLDVPLLLLSADRPPELLDCGANQAIRQQGLFGQHLRAAVHLQPPAQEILTSADEQAIRQLLLGLQQQPGPRQLNIMLREPLYPEPALLALPPQPLPAATIAVSSTASAPAAPLPATAQQWAELRQQQGVIVAGRLTPADGQAVAHWAAGLGWPLLADIQSHARHGATALSPAELALANPALAERLAQARLIIRCGDRLTGKRLNQWLQRCQGQQWLVANGIGERDPLRLSQRVELPLPRVMATYPPATSAHANPGCWLDITAINQQLARLLATAATASLDELSAIATLAPLLPAAGLLFCGNSLAIRLLDQLAIAPAGPVLANRGASGIDGLLASACGAASGHAGPLTLVIGDLSLLHDLNSLALLARLQQPALVVLLNNGGGNIFDLLPVPEALRERYFRTPVRWDAAAACATFAIPHQRPASTEQFTHACQQAWQRNGPTVVEVQVAPGQTAAQLQALAAQITTAALLAP